jgi:CRP-like cAMP-binding protein
MPISEQQKLCQEAANAVRAGDYRAAVEVYRKLEKLLPADPRWPERCAAAYHEFGSSRDELGCLRRALDLLVDQGEVLAAIAICTQILDIDPNDSATLDCLHLLYTEPSLNPNDTVAQLREDGSLAPDDSADELIPYETVQDTVVNAPLVSLELTETIPGARPVLIGDGEAGAINEIPLDLIDEFPFSDEETELSLDEVLQEGRAPAPKTKPVTRPEVTQIDVPEAGDELARIPLFGSLSPKALRQLMTNIRVVRLSPGEVLFREGEPAHTLYVVVDGAVVPIAEGPPRQRLAVIESGEFFGEIGLVTNQPRNATIEALVETKLLAVDRPTMWSIIRGRSDTSKMVLRFLRQRLIDRHVRNHPLFAAFGRRERGALAGQFSFLEVAGDTTLIEQGRACEALFVLLAGELTVLDAAANKPLGQLHAGDLCGAVALVHGEPAAASVVASGKCWVLAMSSDHFRRVLDADPELASKLAEISEHSRADQLAI